MHWVLQENVWREPEYDNLIATLDRFELPKSIHKVVPFIGELIPEVEPLDDKVICFGAYSMRRIAKKNGWIPGVYDLEEFDFRVQLEHWGNRMLNADSEVLRFGDVKFEGSAFIRPIEDSKSFSGKVFNDDEFDEWKVKVIALGKDSGATLDADSLVQMCRTKEIYTEVRYWIVDKNIATRSIYKKGSRVTYDANVDSRFDFFAAGCVSDMSWGWNPLKAFCLDVCETPDGMRIVEINTLNAAGLYAADTQKLVMALEDANR